MKSTVGLIAGVSLAAWSHLAMAECVVPEAARHLDPVAVGFCESDAVFVGKVEARFETVRAFRAEGTETTQHFRTETNTVRVIANYKGKLPAKVTLIAELYDQGETYSFESGKEYLIFAKQLSGDDRYSGATAKCSVQPTLPLADAKAALDRLEQHKKGRKKIDCKRIAPKTNG